MSALLIKNCGQLLTMKGEVPKRGEAMSDLGVIKDAFVYCEEGRIVAVGKMSRLGKISGKIAVLLSGRGQSFAGMTKKMKIVDAEGNVVMPGLIDCHTHAVFAGNRANEFRMRRDGKTYLEILADGGGILSTVKATRKASKEELLQKLLENLNGFLKYGVTTVEIKTGYGLDLKTELKILEVIEEARKLQPVRLVSTFLGAHVVPPEFSSSGKYLKYLMNEVLPKIKGRADFVDIFCEKKAFSPRESKKFLKFAKNLGFKLKMHSEQINRLGGYKVAVKLGAASVDHCDRMNESDIEKLAKSGVVAVLLPLVPWYLKEEFCADGRRMVDEGVVVALATDFNPGTAPSKNIFLTMSMACLEIGLSVEEVLNAVTVNAACALNKQLEIGSIGKGKIADILITKVKDYSEIPYWVGENLVQRIVINGKVAFSEVP